MLLTKVPQTVSRASPASRQWIAPDSLGDDFSRDAVMARLDDVNDEISEVTLGTILDSYRHDGTVHRALIARTVLPASIVERLIRLVETRADLDSLLLRHESGHSGVLNMRAARHRPGWWLTAILAGTR